MDVPEAGLCGAHQRVSRSVLVEPAEAQGWYRLGVHRQGHVHRAVGRRRSGCRRLQRRGRTEEDGVSHRYPGHRRGALRGLHQLFAHRLVGIGDHRRRSHYYRTLARAALQSGRNRRNYSRPHYRAGSLFSRVCRVADRLRTPHGRSTTLRARPSIEPSRTGMPISIRNATGSVSRS